LSGTEDKITLPPDSTGKNQRERKLTLGGQTVYEDVVALDDGNGNLIDPRQVRPLTGSDVVTANAGQNLNTSELVPDYITGQMLYPNYDLNNVARVRASAWNELILVDANLFLPPSGFTIARSARSAVFLDQYNAMYSKRHFKYGSFMNWAKIPLNTNLSWLSIFIGAESTGAALGGGAWFEFVRSTTLKSYIELISLNNLNNRTIDISALIADPSAAVHRYTVKLNRSSAEYYVDAVLVGIIQCVVESTSYDVRLTAPYVLSQVKGQMPTHLPDLIEVNCADVSFVGTQPGFELWSLSATDGEPSPSRMLNPITSGVNWVGTVISSGTLISDPIPIAGYDKKTILFVAAGAGTLYLDVDYGDNAFDQYDSVAVAANTLICYPMTANPLWLRLRFTPTAYPTTVTRARVSMS
jgi:hypothetical protein